MSASELALRKRAMDALARTEKSRAQLLALLHKHTDDEAQVRRVVDQLTAEGLQSDVRAAVARATACHKKGFTAGRTREDLAALDVGASVVTQALEDVFGGVTEKQSLQLALAQLGPLPSEKKRLTAARALIRRGFDPDEVAQALRLDELNPDQADGG